MATSLKSSFLSGLASFGLISPSQATGDLSTLTPGQISVIDTLKKKAAENATVKTASSTVTNAGSAVGIKDPIGAALSFLSSKFQKPKP